MAEVHSLLPGFMLWVLLPLWTLAGAADYLLHRRTGIEKTSGAGESYLHVLQATEVGIPLLAGLFLEINGAVIAIMMIGVLAHTLTALWDTSYSHTRRYISPLEQHVHSHLEYIPLVALALVIIMHWSEFLGVLGVGDHATSWKLALKEEPLPRGVVTTVLVLVFGLQGMLLAEEAWRSMRVANAGSLIRA